jgi:hypothetical protein
MIVGDFIQATEEGGMEEEVDLQVAGQRNPVEDSLVVKGLTAGATEVKLWTMVAGMPGLTGSNN